MRKIAHLAILILIGLINCCTKEQDPFLDTFPSKYVYSYVEKKSDFRLFTNGLEINELSSISDFTYNSIFDINNVDSLYSGSSIEFINKKKVVLQGRLNEWRYSFRDTANYYQEKDAIHLFDTIHGRYFHLDPIPVVYRMEICKVDTLSIYSVSNYEYAIFVVHKSYGINKYDEIRIPVTEYKYIFPAGAEISGLHDFAFDTTVVEDLTSDSLAIRSYELIYMKV